MEQETKKVYVPRKAVVDFERIGRTGSTPAAALHVEVTGANADDAQIIAETLYGHVGKHLRSREYSISVDLPGGMVYIEGGRFGKGTVKIEEVSA